MRQTERSTAGVTAVAGGLAFLLLAWWLVPWDPIPGGPVTPVPASDIFTPDQIARAEDYSHWARIWSYTSLGVSLLVACLLGFTSIGRRLVDRLPGRWWVQVPLAVAACDVIGRVATLPLSAALHELQRDAGLSTQGWAGWLRDVVVSQVVLIVTGGLAVLVLVAVARRWRRAWPAVAGVLLGVLVLLGSFVYPVLVQPLFNDFTPLPDGPLRSSILRLADVEGVQVDQVLVADASRRTTTLNAYVSGFGSTRRVVLYDNLVNDTPQDQVEAVVAHELAHARHDDVLTGSLLGAAGALAGVGLLGLILGRRGGGGGGAEDPRQVPRVLGLVAVATLLVAPLQSGISRAIETRADVDALRATNVPNAFVALQRQLALRSLADPTPPQVAQFWFGSHPTTLARAALARRIG